MAAALLSILLLAAALGACGGDGDSAPRRTATPAGSAASPAPTTSPTPSPSAANAGPPRTLDAVLRRIAGRRIKVDGRTVHVDPATVTCGGLGRRSRRGDGGPEWTRFSCIQPTFPPGAVAGPDLIFTVQSVQPRALVVTERHLTSY